MSSLLSNFNTKYTFLFVYQMLFPSYKILYFVKISILICKLYLNNIV